MAELTTKFLSRCTSEKNDIRENGTRSKKVLFPGYIFVDTSDIELFCQYLAKVPGFKKVLRDADEIAPITEEEKAYLLFHDGRALYRSNISWLSYR